MNLKQEWFGNIRQDVLAGMVVAIAQIPEAIGFSILAGVDPMVGLYASFCIAVVTAFAGGRPGLISAATGAMALIIAGLVRMHGVEYMLAATILAGILQMIFGFLKIGNLLRFIPKPVMTGFVNALGILIFKAQLSYFEGAGINMYLLVAAGIAVIYAFIVGVFIHKELKVSELPKVLVDTAISSAVVMLIVVLPLIASRTSSSDWAVDRSIWALVPLRSVMRILPRVKPAPPLRRLSSVLRSTLSP